MRTEEEIRSLKEEIERRGITTLYHFTNWSNIGSIAQRGLVSRQKLVNEGVEFEYNDENRLERCEDAVCVSIGHPNGRMLYKLTQTCPDETFVVLELKPEILLNDCAFCPKNAASIGPRSRSLTSVQDFRNMFRDENADLPADEQAEVLMFEDIPVSAITGVYFRNDADLDYFTERCEPFGRDRFYGSDRYLFGKREYRYACRRPEPYQDPQPEA